MAKKFLGTVILPGTFDPVTTGHMNSLRYLSERSDKVYAVIMTLTSDEPKRWIPSEVMKKLIEDAIAEEKLDNVFVYIEKEGWLAHTVEALNADGVARSFHPTINIENEIELIQSVIELGIPVHLIPSHLELRSSHIRWLSEEKLMDEFKEQVPASMYRYIQENI